MILEHKAYSAWCRLCDSSASPAHRETRKAATDDLEAHINVQHPDRLDLRGNGEVNTVRPKLCSAPAPSPRAGLTECLRPFRHLGPHACNGVSWAAE